MDVSAVPPGHCLRARLTTSKIELAVERYWGLPDGKTGAFKSREEWQDAFDATLQDAVRVRLRSDVPVGAFLSGGVDSSVVSLLARKESQLRTFTVDFDVAAYSESAYAERVAKSIGTEHTTIKLDASSAVTLPELIETYGDLHGDASAMPTLAVCRAARKHVKVVIAGDGGDELLGGYSRYHRAVASTAKLGRLPRLPLEVARRTAARLWPIWLPGNNRVARLTGDLDTFYASDMKVYGGHRWPPILRPSREPAPDPLRTSLERHHGLPPLQRLMACDAETYLPGDILVKVDRASMSVGLEVRAPLLDHRLFELVADADPSWIANGSSGKRPLKDLYAQRLPPEVFQRPKMGFGVPLTTWFKSADFEGRIHGLLDKNAPLAGVFEPSALSRMVASHQHGVYVQPGRIWYLLVLFAWAERWRPSVAM
jgi:asparagine synthase (glutamine-hydrolysing)